MTTIEIIKAMVTAPPTIFCFSSSERSWLKAKKIGKMEIGFKIAKILIELIKILVTAKIKPRNKDYFQINSLINELKKLI